MRFPTTFGTIATRFNMDEDKLRDIAIAIVNELVIRKYIPDCTDTDDETEFEIQDIIVDTFKMHL